MNKQFYPLKFTPLFYPKIWGGRKINNYLNHKLQNDLMTGESWDISQVKNNVSIVANGSFSGATLTDLIEQYPIEILGNSVYDKYGKQFPLLVKLIDANDNLSIQVHPDDEMAKQKHDSFGKTEMWYVMDADEDAFLISGFNLPISKDDYVESVKVNTIESKLKKFTVKAGDIFYIPAGCVHAIGKGCVILEVQQSSDITYRIFDYNRQDSNGNYRELHTSLAAEAIKFSNWKSNRIEAVSAFNTNNNVIKSPFFNCDVLKLNKSFILENTLNNSFQLISCTSGKLQLVYDANSVVLEKGESVLIPACIEKMEIVPQNECVLLLTKINQ